MITRISRILALTGCCIALASCGGKKDNGGGSGGGSSSSGEIAFVTNGADPFWVLAEAGVNKAVEDFGIKCAVLKPAGGLTEQKDMMEDLLTKGTKGIAVSPIDAANQTDFLNKVAERTKLITHDSDAPDSDRLAYIGMDNYTAGRMCGKLVKEAIPDGGAVMILVGRMEQDNARGRRQGVIDELLDRSNDPKRFDEPGKVIEGDKYKILGTLTDQFDRALAKSNAEDTLARFGDEIKCMVGLFAYNPPLILQALKQAEKVGDVKIVAFDEHDETLQGIKDGEIHGTIVQNPYMYGYKSVEVLKKLLDGDESVIPSGGFIDIPARAIKTAEVDEFWADLKKKLGKE